MQRVFVIDANEQPLMPSSPARARQLLKAGRAVVHRHQPFTIKLLDREGGDVQPVAVKIDPGSRTTGLALVGDFQRGYRLLWAADLQHKGHMVAARMLSRRQLRRARRTRKLRYRAPRFLNRRNKFNKVDAWLPPSLRSRVDNVTSWMTRLKRWVPITNISLELVKFDTQQMANPEIEGVKYQRGTLYGFEVWEYLLEKWGHKCAYCGVENVPLEKEHIVPKGQGGSNRITNLTVSCHKCNQKKGNQTAAEFGYPQVQAKAQRQRPLKDTAAVNATRWAIFRALFENGLPVECGTGGRTKFNRTRQGYDKAHWVDAACVGESGEHIHISPNHMPLQIKAIGRGKRQRQANDKYGFPKGKPFVTHKRTWGFQTGDLVRADIPRGKYAGTHTGRVTIRAKPNFYLNGFNVHPKYCRLLQRGDGYGYSRDGKGGA